ncbi:hypothetical protein C6496_04635 [Candidatus Poribacteria bacterium]|nr:MAG: hypothetical protein C6496_04635 [Candidatus Poribacteria bacterium]
MSKPLKVFITYSHTDSVEKDKLITRLAVMKREGLISIWHDNEILGSDKWREEIFSTNLPNSDILLYLVSAESLASENCNKELAIALDEKIRVIPIILEDCDWKNDQLSDFQAFPERGKPINEWQPESKGWQSVVDGVRKTVHEMQSQAKTSPNVTPEEIETLAFLALHRGNFMVMLDQLEEALKAYSRAIELTPNNANAYNNRGVVRGKRSEYDLAITDFDTALELKPDYAEVYSNRGIAYIKKGELNRAVQDYIKAIELKPDHAEAYNNRGNAYIAKGECDLAIKDCNKAIQLKTDYAEAYYNRGTAYSKKNEIDLAIKDFRKAIELKPDYFAAYNNLGIAYYNKGEFDRAIENYTKAVEIKPDYTEALDNRRAVYRAKRMAYYEKNKSEFGIDYSEAVRRNPDDPSVYYNRGAAFLHLKLWDKARTDLMKARDMGEDVASLFHNFYANVTDFEQEWKVKLPEDIVAMLTPR